MQNFLKETQCISKVFEKNFAKRSGGNVSYTGDLLMLKIGLTGGIASGKTTVAKEFAKLGVPIIDADLITRELMQKDTEISQKIIEHFGSQVLDKTNSLNRTKIADIIFNDSTEKAWLENLIHPAVRTAMAKTIAETVAPYCILVIPLLIETLPNPLVDKIVVVNCSETLQIERLQKRNNLTVEEAKKIIRQQATAAERLCLADDVIENDSGLNSLKTQVKKLHLYFLEIAK